MLGGIYAVVYQVFSNCCVSITLYCNKKGRSDMEMSAKQPLCQSNYDAYEICVWGTQWRPPLPTLPAICAIPHSGDSVLRFFLPFAISLFLFVSCAQQTVDSFCVMKVVGI